MPNDRAKQPRTSVAARNSPATVAALAELREAQTLADFRRTRGYIPTQQAREANGIARGIREALRLSRTA